MNFTQGILFKSSMYSPNDFLKPQGSCKDLDIRVDLVNLLYVKFPVAKYLVFLKVKCRAFSFRKMFNVAGTFFWSKIFAPSGS